MARQTGGSMRPFSSLEGFDLTTAYAVEGLIRRDREEKGHRVTGRKAGYANRAMWRALKLETLVWAHMYDDTVVSAATGSAWFSVVGIEDARIEPEIVFKFREAPAAGLDAEGLLATVEWIAAGFEIIACPYPDWKFQPADFVAAWGLHRGLVIGTPYAVVAERIPEIVEQLQSFKLQLFCNDVPSGEGAGKNSLRSPALCAAEFATAADANPGSGAVAAGELFSSGTLTQACPIQTGQVWRMEIEGLPLDNLTVCFD